MKEFFKTILLLIIGIVMAFCLLAICLYYLFIRFLTGRKINQEHWLVFVFLKMEKLCDKIESL